MDTATAIGRMFFQILSAIAEFEHALMSRRTRDGLAAARARGRTGGQKPKFGPWQVNLVRQIYDELDEHGMSRYTVGQIAAELGVTLPTIYRHLGKPIPSHHGSHQRLWDFVGFSAITTVDPCRRTGIVVAAGLESTR
ncbi:recombinase family protein [Nocardia sp. CDC160]|uniref:recombinase family protein n=1 Tax=Nocardia sp. CDC160 TaxID=3112166 RepID=UPI002DB9E298|nr:recombinase family protein [Nocardia sp. CDC160]MEC3920291.1 recombinase family protein [Nocardia sp. CDC160]